MKELRNSSTYRELHEDEVELLKVQMEAVGEAKRATAMAVKMLKDGFSVADVVKYTGLTKKVVEGLGGK